MGCLPGSLIQRVTKSNYGSRLSASERIVGRDRQVNVRRLTRPSYLLVKRVLDIYVLRRSIMRHRAGVSLLSAVAAAACSGGLEGARATLPSVGSSVPAFTYVRIDTGTVSSTALRGAPTVIALWSSTCSASREALGAILSLQAEFVLRGVRVILLADDPEIDALLSLGSAFGPLPVGHAAGQLKETFSQTRLGPWRRGLGLPSFLVLDRNATVRYTQVGIEQSVDARLGALKRQLELTINGPRT